MITRLGVLFGAGAIGFPSLFLLMYLNLPQEIASGLPVAAKVASISVLIALVLAGAVSLVGSAIILSIGDGH